MTITLKMIMFHTDQCLELCEEGSGETLGVRGQVIVSLVSRDAARGEPATAAGEGSPLAVVGPAGDVRTPRDPRDPPPVPNGTRNPLPQHWEERFTSSGRSISFYIIFWCSAAWPATDHYIPSCESDDVYVFVAGDGLFLDFIVMFKTLKGQVLRDSLTY